jgi:dTDP-glucose 4,6-dehydratase
MKLLVTGGAGFIGSAVVRLAVARGHQVVNLDALTYAANLANVAPVAESPLYAFQQADIRDWIYVEDHADALLLVATKGALGRSYNIGGENERTNLQLVQTICAILDRLRPRDTGVYADLITFVIDRPGHDARYAIDPTRIRAELGWRPSVTVEEGLERTVRWYLENEGWWRPLLGRQGVGQRLGRATP